MAGGFQGAFTGGELDPALSARVDLSKYGVGCKKMENFIAQPHGGAYRRPGLGYVLTALGITRLIPFQYNVQITIRTNKNVPTVVGRYSARFNAIYFRTKTRVPGFGALITCFLNYTPSSLFCIF